MCNEVMTGIKEFIFGGKAEFTIRQINEGKEDKALYKVIESKDNTSFFVWAGSNSKLEYQGYISKRNLLCLRPGKSGKADNRLVKALLWVIKHADNMDERVSVIHHGRCSVCGRKLTDTKSLVYGIGPKCLSKITSFGGN